MHTTVYWGENLQPAQGSFMTHKQLVYIVNRKSISSYNNNLIVKYNKILQFIFQPADCKFLLISTVLVLEPKKASTNWGYKPRFVAQCVFSGVSAALCVFSVWGANQQTTSVIRCLVTWPSSTFFNLFKVRAHVIREPGSNYYVQHTRISTYIRLKRGG